TPDLIIVHMHDSPDEISAVRDQLQVVGKTVPVLVAVDDYRQHKPLTLLEAGADDFFEFAEPKHLVKVVSKALHYHRLRRQAQSYHQQLLETEARSRKLLEHTSEAIAYIHEGAHILANSAYAQLFGFDNPQELQGVTLMDIIDRPHHDALKTFLRNSIKRGQALDGIEVAGLDRQGQPFPLTLFCTPTRINDEPGLQLVVQSENLPTAAAAQQLFLDEVTGLNNRAYFINYLDRLLQNEIPQGTVLYVLLGALRRISQESGLQAGDILLRDIAGRLTEQLSEKDLCARFADAILTVYTPLTDENEVRRLGLKLTKAIRENVSYCNETLLTTSAVVGACLIDTHHQNAFQLLSQANEACEQARQKGDGEVVVYQPGSGGGITSTKTDQDQELVWLLEDALAAERVTLLYQPIVSFQGDTQPRYHVDARLNDAKGKPLDLTRLELPAERHQALLALDHWVVEHALSTVVQARANNQTPPALFIPVSGNAIGAQDFGDWLGGRLEERQLPGRCIVLEVSEQRGERHFKELQELRSRLRTLECGFAISGFTSGEHSERLLQHLTPNYVVLDSELIEKALKARRPEQRNQLMSLLRKASEAQVTVVASNVKSATQMANIWQFGVSLVMGDMVREASPRIDFDFTQFAG
ncbi:MAG: EAL domain-containing protein, partial [Candidatus Competibacterales bacterium]|nr:EAL domain-containing protein [Candidatus Competibacterales bacterium]